MATASWRGVEEGEKNEERGRKTDLEKQRDMLRKDRRPWRETDRQTEIEVQTETERSER